MALVKKKGYFESSKVVYIRTEEIVPNPSQPRKIFDLKGLEELAESIRRHGVIQPISVRRTEKGYELIAGERRLRASKLAGLKEVPAIVLEIDNVQSGLLALVENLQRKDLDFFEEAEGLAKLIRLSGYSQEEAAKRIGKSQSAVANKLRLLRLSPEIIQKMRQFGLSERHARALLRLDNNEDRMEVRDIIIKGEMNVARTEAYIDTYIQRKSEPQPEAHHPDRSLYIIKDIRIFINSVNRGMELLKHSGINASCTRTETSESISLLLVIPK